MPTARHDALSRLFRDRPQTAVEILRDHMGMPLPRTPLVRVEDGTFSTRPSDTLDADVVVVLGAPRDPRHAIIVEIQNDKSKEPRQLARYAAALWLLLRCDVTVLVVCPEAIPAKFYAKPIDSGLTGYSLQPRVLGPDDIPPIIDPEQAAAHPELAAMSVMIHGRDRKVVQAFADGLQHLPTDHAPQYYEYAFSMSAPDVQRLMEEIMTSTTWFVASPFAKEHFGKGEAKGRAEGIAEGRTEGKSEGKAEEAGRMVLLILEARSLTV